jgi:hypothetical protein
MTEEATLLLRPRNLISRSVRCFSAPYFNSTSSLFGCYYLVCILATVCILDGRGFIKLVHDGLMAIIFPNS